VSKKETVKRWIFLADGDLKTAEDELSVPEPFTNTICFHSQQCVEKYLKAYLSFVGKSFRKTHDISELIELCKEIDEEFEILYSLNATKLTRYAIETVPKYTLEAKFYDKFMFYEKERIAIREASHFC
jgi:HEPN domain-containing protein